MESSATAAGRASAHYLNGSDDDVGDEFQRLAVIEDQLMMLAAAVADVENSTAIFCEYVCNGIASAGASGAAAASGANVAYFVGACANGSVDGSQSSTEPSSGFASSTNCNDFAATSVFGDRDVDSGGVEASPPLQYWTLVLLLFPLVTVFGNVLVCLSVFRARSLQTVTNYFIVSLAISDIMVAMLVMPFAVYVEV